jgi:hypothetical protein
MTDSNPTSEKPICVVFKTLYERGCEVDTMCGPNLVREKTFQTIILSDDTVGK